MPMEGIEQPQVIQIEENLRLRRFDGIFDFAFGWYQDAETVYLVDGVKKPYDMATLRGMYGYLDKHGELYFIETMENGGWKPIGDVAFWQDDLPIVLGDRNYRGKGVGRKVVSALVERGKSLGWTELRVGEIYSFNEGSRRCFERVGFRAYERTEKGDRFVLKLD